MIRRLCRKLLRERLAASPAAALVGPRQCGKTTLARTFPGSYFDLEQDADRLRLDLEWESLVSGRKLIILDEAQAWPEVFPRLRGAIDRDRRRHGRFLLLGSVSPQLMRSVSESLAGRLALVELTPLLASEMPGKAMGDLWLHGGYPDGSLLMPRAFPRWQHDYMALLAARDLPDWGMPALPQVTDRFMRMLAAVHGQAWNASRIAQSMGLSHTTIGTYLDFLEAAFLVRRLQPYHANIRKRLVKTPKTYWRDSGLLHALLGVAGWDDLLAHPWVGASWEGFVVEQILATMRARGMECEAYFFRTSDQHEIDLLLKRGSRLWAVEVKLTASPSRADMARLQSTAELVKADRCFLVSQTPRTIEGSSACSCNLPWLLRHLTEF